MPHLYTFKIILIGEQFVGKTTLLQRYLTGRFQEMTIPTIIDCKSKSITVDGKSIKLQIWDTAGQERYSAITREYYRNTDGVLLLYDVTKMETYFKMSSWLAEIQAYAKDAVVLIVGNKNDDPTTKAVAVNTVKRFAEDEGLEFMETSAKTGEKVEEVFNTLVMQILEAKERLEDIPPGPPPPIKDVNKPIKLEENSVPNVKPAKKGCC